MLNLDTRSWKLKVGAKMNARTFAAICLFVALVCGCRRQAAQDTKRTKPTLVLWAWDRTEDLRFLKAGEAEVAGLMATVRLRNGKADMWRRKLPLFVPPGVPLKAVVRLESDGSELPVVGRVSDLIENLTIGDFDSLQIDFDARQSQLDWYRRLLLTLKSTHERSAGVPPAYRSRAIGHISITALASWCVDRPWFTDPQAILDVWPSIQEVVPMLFRMGPHRVELLKRIARDKDFAEGCRGAVGVSLDEPLPWYPPAKRIYIFSPTPWTKEAFDQACARWH
jgi:hypothetical protein